jgi:nucleotide-binding universal stress UspA family protein
MKIELPIRSKALAAPSSPELEPLVRRILVPLDLENSSRALQQAQTLAAATGASIHLLHVVEPAPVMMGLDGVPVVTDPHDLARECAAQLAQLAESRSAPGLPVSSAVQVGQPSRTILAVAEGIAADLLVMATHARKGFAHFVLGSVAEHVVRAARSPVLVVRDSSADESGLENYSTRARFRKILVPVDFSRPSMQMLAYPVRFAETFGGRITLLHVVELGGIDGGIGRPENRTLGRSEAAIASARSPLAALAEASDGSNLIVATVIRTGTPSEEIAGLAGTGEFDLIGCSTHGALHRALLGGTVEAILRRAACPLLVVSARVANAAAVSVS